jgi:hypothetical protein
MNNIDHELIKIFHNKENIDNQKIQYIYNYIEKNNIYKKSNKIDNYNLDIPINRFSSAVEILNKHLQNSKYELDKSREICNNLIPIKKK